MGLSIICPTLFNVDIFPLVSSIDTLRSVQLTGLDRMALTVLLTTRVTVCTVVVRHTTDSALSHTVCVAKSKAALFLHKKMNCFLKKLLNFQKVTTLSFQKYALLL